MSSQSSMVYSALLLEVGGGVREEGGSGGKGSSHSENERNVLSI